MASKNDIRSFMQEKRRLLDASERQLTCGYVCEKLLGVTLPQSAVVAGYSATQNEVDIFQALKGYCQRNIPVCLPVVTKPEMILEFVEWTPGVTMRAGAFGILEPQGGKKIIPNVLLVPLLAFDRRGHRVGYGAGYYDATITSLKAANPALLTVGIGYSFQEVPEVPSEAHDARLDVVVTDKDVITSSRT